MKEQWIARQHFDHLARKYNSYRTLDKTPIDFLLESIPGTEQSICDLGSGTGRYFILLIESFQTSSVVVKEAHGTGLKS